MWMSMTGFGRGEAQAGEVSAIAEVRSVNHRFLDVHVRCPARYMSWETRVRSLVRASVRRGKVDVFLTVRDWGRAGTAVRVNRGLLASFLDEIGRVRRESALEMDLSLRDLLAVPDLFVFAPEGGDPAEANWAIADQALRGAVEMLLGSRRDEGERMRSVIADSIGRLRGIAAGISSLSRENKELALVRFRERVEALSAEAGTDPVRLHQEAAYLADRLDVTEECDRMVFHLAGLDKLLQAPGDAVGKRFDFLLQELFRELNTAASKSAHVGISQLAVEAKTELEKVREQIQNVE